MIKRRLLWGPLLLLASLLQAEWLLAYERLLEGKAIKIADGDTITLLQESGDKVRIRLSGV